MVGEKKFPHDSCPKCDKPLTSFPAQFTFRGRSFPGLVCCNALWEDGSVETMTEYVARIECEEHARADADYLTLHPIDMGTVTIQTGPNADGKTGVALRFKPTGEIELSRNGRAFRVLVSDLEIVNGLRDFVRKHSR